MTILDLRLTQRLTPSGLPAVRLGEPWLDAYLDFLTARCRPNSVLAAGYDLKVFFSLIAKTPAKVTAADVLGFITAHAPVPTRPADPWSPSPTTRQERSAPEPCAGACPASTASTPSSSPAATFPPTPFRAVYQPGANATDLAAIAELEPH